MRLPEQKLWDAMASNLPRDCWAQRVENGVGAGMPDVLFIDRLAATNVHWVELKVNEKRPARKTTAVLGDAKGMRPEQVNWHLEWAMFGGISWILVGVGSGRGRKLMLIPGESAREVNGMSLEFMESNYGCADWFAAFRTMRVAL